MDVLCVLTVMLILVNARNKQNCFMWPPILSHFRTQSKSQQPKEQNISRGQLLHDRNAWPSRQPCKEASKAKAIYLYKNKKKNIRFIKE